MRHHSFDPAFDPALDPAFDCPEVLERLPLFVGEDLEPDVNGAVVRHLERCAACRAHEARARVARERFRGVLDESLRSCTRVGLWPELRARLVDEGLLPGVRLSGAPPDVRVRVPGAESTAAPARARASFAPRRLRLLAALAAAAAVLVTVFASDPFERLERRLGPGSSDGPSAGSATPIVPVANAAGAGSGGLRRLGAQERSLSQDAEPLQRDGLPLQRPARLSDTTLVHYR